MSFDFEWDAEKAAANLTKHGVSFPLATSVFDDPHSLDREDDREDYGEARRFIVGLVDDMELAVAYTWRGDCIRLISARRATPHEQRKYWKNR
ncbi:protein containing DUF497 [mine drainage metagenome]|uniref:Protein containing DUF497 n=1 Tax=mine drainage metagenome TaxID=410659 RepID=T1A272_9ZZZZ